MLNELIYNPSGAGNTTLLNLIQGAATFISGQVSKTGEMFVQTPSATVGIRGTIFSLSMLTVDGQFDLSVLEYDGELHEVTIRSGSSTGPVIGIASNRGGIWQYPARRRGAGHRAGDPQVAAADSGRNRDRRQRDQFAGVRPGDLSGPADAAADPAAAVSRSPAATAAATGTTKSHSTDDTGRIQWQSSPSGQSTCATVIATERSAGDASNAIDAADTAHRRSDSIRYGSPGAGDAPSAPAAFAATGAATSAPGGQHNLCQSRRCERQPLGRERWCRDGHPRLYRHGRRR